MPRVSGHRLDGGLDAGFVILYKMYIITYIYLAKNYQYKNARKPYASY